MKFAVLVLTCAAVLSCTAHGSGESALPPGVPMGAQPTRAQIDRAMDHLSRKRDKAQGAEREKIDHAMAYLKAYKANGMDARRAASAVKPDAGSRARPSARPSAGSSVRPPVKGGVFKPGVAGGR